MLHSIFQFIGVHWIVSSAILLALMYFVLVPIVDKATEGLFLLMMLASFLFSDIPGRASRKKRFSFPIFGAKVLIAGMVVWFAAYWIRVWFFH